MIQEVKDIDMFTLLQNHGVNINKNNQCLCVFHNESNPSMAVYPTKVKDFHSGEVEDVIAVYMALNNMGADQFKQAVTELHERYIANVGTVKAYTPTPRTEQVSSKPTDKNKKPKRKNTLTQADADFVPFDTLNDFDKVRIQEYFRQRGIPSAIDDIKECGYDVGLDGGFKVKGDMWNIMYMLNGFYVKRGLYNQFKGNMGTSQVTKFHKYKNSKDWCIVEGITDAMSIFELNRQNGMEYNVICLNSTSNVTKFIKSVEVEQVKKAGFIFIEILDQDESGVDATQRLIDFFDGKGILHERMTILDSTTFKDINELLAHTQQQELNERYRKIGLEVTESEG